MNMKTSRIGLIEIYNSNKELFLECKECVCPFCNSNKQVWHAYEGYHICLECKESYW